VGPTDRREREKQLLRRKILDVSRELFAERGYDAVTMRTIAEAIEYSPRTIYLHFKDKEDLIRELCQEDFLAFGEELARGIAIPDPLDRVRAIGHSYAAFALAYPHHYRLMFMTAPQAKPEHGGDGKGNPEVDAYALLRSTLEEAITAGLLRPDWTDPDLAAQVVWSGMHGLMSLAITHKEDAWVAWTPVQARIEAMTDVLIRGMRR